MGSRVASGVGSGFGSGSGSSLPRCAGAGAFSVLAGGCSGPSAFFGSSRPSVPSGTSAGSVAAGGAVAVETGGAVGTEMNVKTIALDYGEGFMDEIAVYDTVFRAPRCEPTDYCSSTAPGRPSSVGTEVNHPNTIFAACRSNGDAEALAIKLRAVVTGLPGQAGQ